MGAEFIPVMSGSEARSTFDHDVTRHVAGDAESLRLALADALEEMNYRVLNETPLQARRSAKSSAQSGCSQNVRDYQTSLEIGLKPTGANATRVSFAYTIKGVYSNYLTKGDRNTLTREAEAIIATALARMAAAHCSACGADTAGSSRFCRQCGTPLASDAPAEIEVLRLTSVANSNQKSISAGMLFFLMAIVLSFTLFFGSDDPVKFAKMVRVIGTISTALGSAGILMILFSWFKLRQAISEPIEQKSLPTVRRHGLGIADAPDTNELPPASIQHPITEATTDLLPHEIKRAS
ncbi:MAG: zinc ribbon domain-containing protein [Acidobacteria bacterium]|nr:zinc ribbon domain-containing protein [Acidobacteriota bacterium]